MRLTIVITCGMYPIVFPGIPDSFDPGLAPYTQISPESNFFKPTIEDKIVVLLNSDKNRI